MNGLPSAVGASSYDRLAGYAERSFVSLDNGETAFPHAFKRAEQFYLTAPGTDTATATRPPITAWPSM